MTWLNEPAERVRANSVTSFASESVSAPIQQTISNIVFIRLEIEEACAFSNNICLGNLSSCVKDSGNNLRTNHV